MLFPKRFDPRSPNKAKGVAVYAPRPWPNRIIPYDLSSITCECHYQTRSKFFAMIICFVASTNQNIIRNAMQRMMYDVGTPIPGQTSRRTCVYFRPKQSQDRSYVRVIYGDGCSGTVRENILLNRCLLQIILRLLSLDTGLTMFQQ